MQKVRLNVQVCCMNSKREQKQQHCQNITQFLTVLLMSATDSPMLGSDKVSFSVEVAKAQPHNAAPLASVSTAPKTPTKFMSRSAVGVRFQARIAEFCTVFPSNF